MAGLFFFFFFQNHLIVFNKVNLGHCRLFLSLAKRADLAVVGFPSSTQAWLVVSSKLGFIKGARLSTLNGRDPSCKEVTSINQPYNELGVT